VTLVSATRLPADQRLAAMRTTQTRSGLKIRSSEIAAAAFDLWLGDVVDDLEDVPNAPNHGQFDRNDDHEDEKEVHGADFTG
jgi:hypothetical protein